MSNNSRTIIRVKLKTSHCNIFIQDGLIGKWAFNWENDLITAFTYLTFDVNSPSDIFDKTRTTADLVLLIDVLTLAVNQDVNTSIVISTDPVIDCFTGKLTHKSVTYQDFCYEIRTLRIQTQASSLNGEMPKRINETETLTFYPNTLDFIREILIRVGARKVYSKELKKLINYWRKGVDLDQLGYVDESFLSFFKIVEYIAKRAGLKDSDIPSEYQEPRSLKMAYRFAAGAKLKEMTEEKYQMLNDFIEIRNNFDIAHSKIRPLSQDLVGGLYYSFMESVWEYHSHICQITRMVLLREIGVGGISLVNEGGLYTLTLDHDI